MEIQTARRLVQGPESFHIIGIQLKQLAYQALGDFSGRQIHPIQRPKQRQQIESGSFQTRSEVDRNFRRRAASHSLSMAHRGAAVNGKQG
ncbi:MAG TPA: hypothetical protein VII81_02485 [Terriglobales bacterium]